MKILVCCLVYGNRPLDIIYNNLKNAGMQFDFKFINTEGISNAMNEGLDYVFEYDAIAYLANDIEEPIDWLKKKADALQSYPEAGIVASSLDNHKTHIESEFIISNWLIKKEVVDSIGLFNEEYFPYGAIDLEYCQRTWLAGFKTYYVMSCKANHIGSHASGNEYGYSKEEMVNKYWAKYVNEIEEYRNKTKDIKIWKK
jgi:GT2 family glycosyltransferase